jgi:hypothetical protein
MMPWGGSSSLRRSWKRGWFYNEISWTWTQHTHQPTSIRSSRGPWKCLGVRDCSNWARHSSFCSAIIWYDCAWNLTFSANWVHLFHRLSEVVTVHLVILSVFAVHGITPSQPMSYCLCDQRGN